MAAACLVAALTAGCESSREMSPSGPSPLAGPAQPESTNVAPPSGFTSTVRPPTTPPPTPPTPSRPDTPGSSAVVLQGTVAQLNGVCPSVTFKLNRVQIKTSDATTFAGVHCVDLKDGAAVKVNGVREGDGVVKASTVEAVGTEPTPQTTTVELRGTVGNLRGTCSTVTFHLGRVAVSTSVETVFEGLRCEDLRNGAYVKVTGTRSSNGTVTATSVESESHDSRTFEVKGKISGVTGTCPSVTFTVGIAKTSANDRTHYRGLTCADLATWTEDVLVKGQVQQDRSLLATQVVADKH